MSRDRSIPAPRIEVVDLWSGICTDCAMLTANGTLGNEDEVADQAHAEKQVRFLGSDAAHLVLGDTDNDIDFSTNPCGACGCTLAGTRHQAALLIPVKPKENA